MTVSNHAPRDMTLHVDQVAHLIRLERRLEAPPQHVFEAWTTPEQVACWWDPSGQPLAICEIDLRPGGAFKFVSEGDHDITFAGVYREIAPPDRLAFEAMGALGLVLFREVQGATGLTVEIQCRSAEHLRQFLKAGVDEGASRTLDNLVAYVGAGAKR
jgi:uncharacterized protein YndB with AHSA1/START domain